MMHLALSLRPPHLPPRCLAWTRALLLSCPLATWVLGTRLLACLALDQQGFPAVPSLEHWALKNEPSMELPWDVGEKKQHGKVEALRLISCVVIGTFEPVCGWMALRDWNCVQPCGSSAVHFPLRGFLREREVGWLLGGMLVFKWALTFPPGLTGMGIKAAEALIWVVQLSFVKGNLIRRAGIEREKLCFPLDSHEASLWAVNGRDPPNTPKPGRFDCLATRELCNQPGVLEQEGFFGIIFSEPRNVSEFRKDVRKKTFFCFHVDSQSSSVKGSSPRTQNSDAVE